MMAWPALVVGRTLGRRGAAVAALGGGALAGWDVFLDPQMVDAGHWRWAVPDPGLPLVPGVPLTNYAGWVLVSVAIVALLDRNLEPIDRAVRAGRRAVPVDVRLVGGRAPGLLRPARFGAGRRPADGRCSRCRSPPGCGGPGRRSGRGCRTARPPRCRDPALRGAAPAGPRPADLVRLPPATAVAARARRSGPEPEPVRGVRRRRTRAAGHPVRPLADGHRAAQHRRRRARRGRSGAPGARRPPLPPGPATRASVPRAPVAARVRFHRPVPPIHATGLHGRPATGVIVDVSEPDRLVEQLRSYRSSTSSSR